MNKIINWVSMSCFVMLISMLTACGGGMQTGRVAIIDLEAIAIATGKSKDILAAITELAKQRESQLTKLKGELSAKVDEEKGKLGKKPSDEQKQSLSVMENKANLALRQGIAIAKQDTQKLRLKLINDFKQEILPVAIKVATKKNYSIVLVKSANLFYVDAEADITKAVIANLAKGAK